MSTRLLVTSTAILILNSWAMTYGQTPTPEFALQYRPAQPDVEYDKPAAADVKRCRVELERSGNVSGFAVFDPNGQILRRYVDTNKDRYIDQWRYYHLGIEVYRDIDADFNNKIDQSRWVNNGGSRWGIDSNEDGKIDGWKKLSAEEASLVAITALAKSDAKLMGTVLINRDDVRNLKLNDAIAAELLAAVKSPESKMRESLGASATVTSQSRWSRFDARLPATIPLDDGKAAADLTVYEGAMAIVETAGKHGFVQLGEMIKVGDVWKLTQVPRPMVGNTIEVAGGILMRPPIPTGQSLPQSLSKEMQVLIQQLQALDEKPPSPDAPPAAILRHIQQRNVLLEKIVVTAAPEDYDTWTRQLVNGLASAIQAGDTRAGSRLTQVRQILAQRTGSKKLVAYAEYRELVSGYSVRLRSAKNAEDQQKTQAKWLGDLADFAEKYPQAEDTPDAMLQLAMNAEFSGKDADARKWYGGLQQKHADDPAGVRAVGALKRIGMKGKLLKLTGPATNGRTIDVSGLKGKVVLVVFWASWSPPFVQELPVLRAMYEQYQQRGFEIVGINLDGQPTDLTAFAQQNRITWPNIFQAGGLDAPLAQEYGILSVPTMFLLDRNGRVLSNNVTVNDLKEQLVETFKTASTGN